MIVSKIILCNDQKPACVLVDPMDDAGTLNTADPRKLTFTVMKERIYQSSVKVSSRRVNDHANGLINDDYILVLINHVKRNILSLRFVGDCGRQLYFNRIAVLDAKLL